MDCLVCSEGSEQPRRGHMKLVDFYYYYPQGGNSCWPHTEVGAGVMGIGESVAREDQKITRCQTTVILILKEKHIGWKRKGSGEESAPDLMGFFHWQIVICGESQKAYSIISFTM